MRFIDKVKEIYQYRHMLFTLVKQDLQGRYKGSVFGFLWTLLNPLFMLLIYSVVFQFVFKSGIEHYPIYLFVSLMPWNAFNSMIGGGTTCASNNASILKKVYFPREIIPISITTSQLVNFLITCIIMAVFIIFSGVGFSVHALLFPLLVLIQYILILGLTFILSALTVFVRDIDHFVSVILMLGFYATPIVYQGEMLPKKFQIFLKLNPMAQLVEAYRSILYYHRMPDMTMLIIWGLGSIALLVIGYLIFKKLEKSFVEEL